MLLFMLAQNVCAQGFIWNRCGDVFDRHMYPADSFSVRRMAHKLGGTEVYITLLRYPANGQQTGYAEDQVWVEQRRGKTILKSVYLGGISSGESGVLLPLKQPLNDFFMVQDASEFTGTYYLIHKSGIWYELPGATLLSNQEKTVFYTTVPEECGGCTVSKFVRSSRKVATKISNGKQDAWAELKDTNTEFVNFFKNGTWVKW